MSEEIEDLMIDSIEDILEEARSGAISPELLVASIHRKDRPVALVYVAVEHGDGVGHDEVRDFCEEAQEHLLPGERLSIEAYGLGELLEGGEE